MFNIRKLFFFLSLALTMSVVSITSAYAVNPCVPRPGCSCKFYEAAEHHADAQRVRDKAYTRQMKKQPDNTLGMNCYDKALILASRQGQIFSDTYAGSAFAPANYKAFDPAGILGNKVYDPSSGVGTNPATGKNKILSSNYDFVFGAEAKDHVGPKNFGDTLSAWLGATIFGFLQGFLGSINAIFASITGFITNITNQFNTYLGYINQIQNWLDIIGAALPSVVLTTVALIQGMWSTISGALMAAVNGIQNAIMTAINSIVSMVQGLIGSLLQFLGAGNDPCSRIKRLWNPASISGQLLAALSAFDPGAGIAAAGALGFRPMEGGGIEQGAPYFDFQALVSGVMNNPLGGAINLAAALDLSDELKNTLNQPILNAALTDLQAGGLLNTRQAPGAGVIWPTIPAAANDPSPFTPPTDAAGINAALAAIIAGM